MKSLYTTSPSSGSATSLMTYESGMPLVAGITDRRFAKLVLHTSQEFESLSLPGSAAFDITSVWLAKVSRNSARSCAMSIVSTLKLAGSMSVLVRTQSCTQCMRAIRFWSLTIPTWRRVAAGVFLPRVMAIPRISLSVKRLSCTKSVRPSPCNLSRSP